MSKITFDSTTEQRAYIRKEWREFVEKQANAEPRETPRTWSFELETPNADTVRKNLADMTRADNEQLRAILPDLSPLDLINFCSDGSVESNDGNDECECDCSDCIYHECNCDGCEIGSDDPQHDCGGDYCYTGAGSYQEIKPMTYCEGTHPKHLALLDLADIESVEINNTCGLHIHLGSADLTARDLANTIRVYRAMSHLIAPIAGRAGTYYAQDNTEAQEHRQQYAGEYTEKYYAVNTLPHYYGATGNRSAQTIEFRQHEGTNDTAEIRAWAILLMQIVEYAKTNRSTLWLASAQTFGEAWRVLTAK